MTDRQTDGHSEADTHIFVNFVTTVQSAEAANLKPPHFSSPQTRTALLSSVRPVCPAAAAAVTLRTA